MSDLLTEVYMGPWTRISPYLMGTLTAIFLQQNKSLRISQVNKSFISSFDVISQLKLTENAISTMARMLLNFSPDNDWNNVQISASVAGFAHDDRESSRSWIRFLLGDRSGDSRISKCFY